MQVAPAGKEIVSEAPTEGGKTETVPETDGDNPWENFAAIDLV